MIPDSWTIIGTGIVILIAIATSNYRLRNEIRSEIRDVRGEVKELRERMTRLETELRERMAKVEGLLEGLREAISGRHVA
ncbi:MAG: hypothetical protein J4F42_19250 [Desulfurellaceae bacterium]|nr:hypothetical protein [Desulfurellaceae bacterium]